MADQQPSAEDIKKAKAKAKAEEKAAKAAKAKAKADARKKEEEEKKKNTAAAEPKQKTIRFSIFSMVQNDLWTLIVSRDSSFFLFLS